jgi:hypothetical protein
MSRCLLLAVLGCLVLIMAVVVASDLIAHPRDRWAALLFLLGSLCGVAWQRWRPR